MRFYFFTAGVVFLMSLSLSNLEAYQRIDRSKPVSQHQMQDLIGLGRLPVAPEVEEAWKKFLFDLRLAVFSMTGRGRKKLPGEIDKIVKAHAAGLKRDRKDHHLFLRALITMPPQGYEDFFGETSAYAEKVVGSVKVSAMKQLDSANKNSFFLSQLSSRLRTLRDRTISKEVRLLLGDLPRSSSFNKSEALRYLQVILQRPPFHFAENDPRKKSYDGVEGIYPTAQLFLGITPNPCDSPIVAVSD